MNFENNYNQENDRFVYNKEQMIKFFRLMKKLGSADYDERVKIMLEEWGEQKELPKTYYYGEKCNIVIYKEGNKYRFTFNCDNGDLNELYNCYPELAEDIVKQGEEQLHLQKPELFNVSETESVQDSSLTDEAYLNLYRNLNVKHNQANEKED